MSAYNLRSRNVSNSFQNLPNGSTKCHLANGNGQIFKENLPDQSLQVHPSRRVSLQLDENQKEEIQSLVLWRHPFKTIYHAIQNLIVWIKDWYRLAINHMRLCLSLASFFLLFMLLLNIDGIHRPYFQFIYKRFAWCLYWCGLGILSSVGLGTGLHTFILYLGPHIAAVTLAAYECNSLEFPEPPYPDEIICPSSDESTTINVWSIMSKVRLEAFMWGAGTALGELPPYFISRAHRLASHSEQNFEPEPEEILEELEEIRDLMPENDDSESNESNHSLTHTLKTKMILFVERLGFFGILACASIPNPLFDLAGIICGYSLISFWTFFGATLLGKAVIKMHIQKLIVIIVFNDIHVQSILTFCRNIPYVGLYIHDQLRVYLQQQKANLNRGKNLNLEAKGKSLLPFLFEGFVIIMVTYFTVSIINSMAQHNLKQKYQNEMRKKSVLNLCDEITGSSSKKCIKKSNQSEDMSTRVSSKKSDKND
ncbi:Vacuole membrane protein 1 [Sarcoptes scabiei]|uniref:Vacuole membrane protein 1 n=1 Tax=Sarcoptes scabiei TaxID=52283 RepID=A0A834R1L3_SARSC|nr:Vacuole membrane protein 1 [Sarcoptes scabiei]